jgi:hypothetical protein
MKVKEKQKGYSVKLLDKGVLKTAQIICIQKDLTIQEYVTQAVKEKNEKSK